MGSRKYGRILLCVGTAALAGMLSGGEAGAEVFSQRLPVHPKVQTKQVSFMNIKEFWNAVGAEYQYIEGLEDIGECVLQKLEETGAAKDELVLFSRVKGLEGTRVYANVTNYVNVRQKASTASKVVGKLYADCVATVMEEEGNWAWPFTQKNCTV